jgi:acetyl esterase
MPLDPFAQAVLDQLATAPPLHTMSVAQAREFATRLAKSMGPGERVGRVEDKIIRNAKCDVTLRIYTPLGDGPFPIYVYFHGGGWVIGNLDTEDASCREICNCVGCIVVSVDYRHAPEHKFPTAIHDAYEATCWIADNAATFGGDPSRLAVGGTSAGGALATVVAMIARDRNQPHINYQVMITPVTNCAFDTASHQECARGYGLERATMEWFWNHYFATPCDREDVYASPLRAEDLRGLPPTLIITAQYDPLRSEGETYGERLRAAGVDVTYQCLQGMIHLYLGPDAPVTIAAKLRECFAVT